MIRLRRLPRTLANELDPFVRDKYDKYDKYLELWQAVEASPGE